MTQDRKKTLITFLILFSISFVIFSIVSFIQWNWLTGFIFGSIIGLLIHLSNEFFLLKILSKRRSFKNAFLWSSLKFIIFILLMTGLLISILFANKQFNNSFTNGVFNIFTCLYGISLIWISIVVFNFFNLYSDKIKNKKNSGGE